MDVKSGQVWIDINKNYYYVVTNIENDKCILIGYEILHKTNEVEAKLFYGESDNVTKAKFKKSATYVGHINELCGNQAACAKTPQPCYNSNTPKSGNAQNTGSLDDLF